MTPLKRAVLKLPDREQEFLLYRAGAKSFRWAVPNAPANGWLDSNDNSTESAAIAWLRTYCERQFPGGDLTLFPVADPPEVRAARLIVETDSVGWGVLEVADCIQRETRCDELLEVLNELAAYIATRLADRDPALNPIMLKAIRVVESASGADLENLRKLYGAAVEKAGRRIITN